MKRRARQQQYAPFSKTSAISIFLSLITLVANVAVSNADIINILSQQYSIGGEGSVPTETGRLTVSYDLTSSNPLSKNVSISSSFCCDAGAITMNSSAMGEITPDYASVSIFRFFDNIGDGSITRGYALASLTFFHLVNSMVITPDIHVGLAATGSIFDVTTGSLLYSVGTTGAPPALLSFNLSDVYIMSIASSSPYAISTYPSSLSLQAVPEPATLSLLGVGLAGFAALRRKFSS